MLSQKKRVEKAQEMLNLAEGSPEGISQDVIDLLKDNLDIEKRGVDQVPATDLARFIAKCRNVLPDQ